MSVLYLGILLFLFALAICDLSVGVAGSAVPFMSPAMGSKAAKFRILLAVAAVGVFVGAATSDGMMDVARHGIMTPTYFSFDDIICICLAVTATDIILMDIFNTLGLPTSTTVSMVFGLLGSSSAIALFKIAQNGHTYAELINTDKALQIIISIFASVAIAFVFGSIVMWLTRIIFTFNYRRHLKYSIAIFGGFCITCIMYFLLVKGLRGTSLLNAIGMTPNWLDNNSSQVLFVCFIIFTCLMQILHWCRVNVLKVIVFFGTFSLAMAFAGNDLVNFIGVPLTSLEAFLDISRHPSADPHTYTMGVLTGPSVDATFNAIKPWFFVGSGAIMMIALCLSKKARKVVENSNSLASQTEGEEVFSSSKIARSIVRQTLIVNSFFSRLEPNFLKGWLDTRFNEDESIMPEGATFDLVRACVNLVLAGLLIVVGTSLQLPLSTTYVAFMVGMGSSLADRAWGRETAVYRITGVITVVGGWFVTAGAAFIMSSLVATMNHLAGIFGMILVIIIVVVVLIRNNRAFKKKQEEETVDLVFRKLVHAKDKNEVWDLLVLHVKSTQVEMIDVMQNTFNNITQGVMKENIRQLRTASHELESARDKWKRYRRKEIVGMRRLDYLQAVEKNTWFHLGSNNLTQIFYCLKRMLEPSLEHVDNNFNPLPEVDVIEFTSICKEVDVMLTRTRKMVDSGDFTGADEVLVEGNFLKKRLSEIRHSQQDHLQHEEENIRATLLYLNMLQETQEFISMIRHLVRASKRFQE
ncbi:inorganic phosphate transporter [Alloprevotella rava]|uniref:Phosphate transporter n=2 Tax=Alloprevotella rava TaxID=671218 RepID=G5G9F6_9BACT|nr:inorganic phosphate transporter [Alloprevotella rava]EHG24370.1 hypothetical protein HMPREF9332_00207 [Alloprevotella rava F0323]